MKVRVFICFVTFLSGADHMCWCFVCVGVNARTSPQFRRSRLRHWGYTGNPPALDMQSERIGGSRIPEGALTPRAERPAMDSGELVNREVPLSREFENLRLG